MILHSYIKQLIAKPTFYTILQQTTKIYYVVIFFYHKSVMREIICDIFTFVIGIFKKGKKKSADVFEINADFVILIWQ